MSATYINFDEHLQSLGYRAKTWDFSRYWVFNSNNVGVGDTHDRSEIKAIAENDCLQEQSRTINNAVFSIREIGEICDSLAELDISHNEIENAIKALVQNKGFKRLLEASTSAINDTD